MAKNIYVLYGGVSAEHDVSIVSAANVLNALNKEKYQVYPIYITGTGSWVPLEEVKEQTVDQEQLRRETELSSCESVGAFFKDHYLHGEDNLFLPVLHGTNGEDGTIQGMFEILDVPYLGNGVLSSAACMDKCFANIMMQAQGIPKTPFYNLEKFQYDAGPDEIHEEIEKKLNYPIFVKPANAGSSVGVSKVENRQELEEGILRALRFDKKIVIEEAVIGRELEIGVLGNDFPISSLPGEHVVTRAIFDYEAKYHDKTTVLKAPTELPAQQEDEARALAVKAYQVMGCNSFARVDIFMRDSDKAMLVNEINTFPGMTGSSLVPILWSVTDGTKLPLLLDRLISLGEESYREKKRLARVRE